MKLELYNEILHTVRSTKRGECVKLLKQKYPHISVATLGSIVSLECQRKTKKTHHRHHTPEMQEKYYKRYCADVAADLPSGFLVKLADEVDLSPSLMARIILEQSQNDAAKTKDENAVPVTKSQVSKLLKDTTLIEDEHLALEVYLCILQDDHYGPIADTVKGLVGEEYEYRLQIKLKELNIAHQDENQLRQKGYDKTPDFYLQVPIAVDGCVVNWIESKASFGDDVSHKAFLQDQFWSYRNRFGPGLVIYWFGFLDVLDQTAQKGIMLRDSFPEDITFMRPLSLAKT